MSYMGGLTGIAGHEALAPNGLPNIDKRPDRDSLARIAAVRNQVPPLEHPSIEEFSCREPLMTQKGKLPITTGGGGLTHERPCGNHRTRGPSPTRGCSH